MPKVAVLVVHGIGWRDDGTDTGFVAKQLARLMDPPASAAKLRTALEERISADSFVLRLADWGKRIEPVQRRFEERSSELRWDFLRRVVISALGDAAQYEAAVYSSGKQ